MRVCTCTQYERRSHFPFDKHLSDDGARRYIAAPLRSYHYLDRANEATAGVQLRMLRTNCGNVQALIPPSGACLSMAMEQGNCTAPRAYRHAYARAAVARIASCNLPQSEFVRPDLEYSPARVVSS